MFSAQAISIFILLAPISFAAGEECTTSSEDCLNNQADAVALIQTNMKFSVERKALASTETLLAELVQQHRELQHKKMEFFSKVVEESKLNKESKAAHDEFRQFLASNERDYDSLPGSPGMNLTEYLGRLETFAETLRIIEARNAHEGATNTHPNPALHGVTKYADWSLAEFSALLGTKNNKDKAAAGYPSSRILSTPNATADGNSLLETSTSVQCTKTWLSRLPEVRNQGSCGNCWTYAIAKNLRSAYIQQHWEDPGELSTQFITDCMEQKTCSDGVNGCCGGDPMAGMEWITQQGGIPTAEAYGDVYTSASLLQTGINSSRARGPVSPGEGSTYSGNHPTTVFPCKSGIAKSVTLTKSPVQMTTEADMANYVCETGTLSVVVDASAWQTYVGGVMQASSCGTSTDHAVTAIGMNESAQSWIVQNQWGAPWGVAIDGSTILKDGYSNCATLAANNGCDSAANPWIKTSCALSCSGGTAAGGYIYLQYGQNTCGINSEAIAPTSTAVGGAAPPPRLKQNQAASSGASWGICVQGTGPRGCNFKSSNCGGTVAFSFKCGSWETYSITMSDNSEYDLAADCASTCSNINIKS
jgi:cathepsin O